MAKLPLRRPRFSTFLMQNKATKLLKPQWRCPESDKSKPMWDTWDQGSGNLARRGKRGKRGNGEKRKWGSARFPLCPFAHFHRGSEFRPHDRVCPAQSERTGGADAVGP